MNITFATLFPSLYDSFISTSIIKKAHENNLCAFNFVNMLEMAGPLKRVDSKTVGHGAGMRLGPDIIEKTFNESVKFNKNSDKKPFTIFFSPHGKKLDQNYLKDIYKKIQE